MAVAQKRNQKLISSQPLSAKRGEVRFRKRLVKQHFGGRTQFPQEYKEEEIDKALFEKTKRARDDFVTLSKKKVVLSPFLEIGTGYGQASLVLVNDFGAEGFASDLAQKPLTAIKKTAKKLGLFKLPKTLVLDAETIPFPNNSFPFVFCYQTLHHFPHPGRVIREIHRVLEPGGYFFFSEEPITQSFNIALWRRPTKLRFWEKALKATLILPFISRIGKTEVDHGILEETFPLSVWKRALSPFTIVETELEPFPFGPKGNLIKKNGRWQDPSRLNRVFLFFLGGGIKGLVRKSGRSKTKHEPSFLCVNCKNQAQLKEGRYKCPSCNYEYKTKDDILILLPEKIEKNLYKSLR